MAALAWSFAVPASLYVTRSVGATVSQGLLRNPAPEPLDESIDTEGALASADAALRLVPVSPTANHLRSLVKSGARRLRDLVQACEDRQRRRSFSRLFRNPCFREENSRLRSESETLKSRVHLFLTVVSLFPEEANKRIMTLHPRASSKSEDASEVKLESKSEDTSEDTSENTSENTSEDTSQKLSVSDVVDGEEVHTKESVSSAGNASYMRSKVKRELGRISLVRAFARNLTASQDTLGSSDADSEASQDNEYETAEEEDEDDSMSDSVLASALRHWVP